MTDEQNARLNEAQRRAEQLFYAGKLIALRRLADELHHRAAEAAREAAELIEYRAALIQEADQIMDTVTFLASECAEVAHG